MARSKRSSGTPSGGTKPAVADLAAKPFGDSGDLMEQISFRPTEGRIWLAGRRMVMFHTEAWGAMRQELVETVGMEAARGMLTRSGYIAGSRDVALAWKVRAAGTQHDVLRAGALIHALMGIVQSIPVQTRMDAKAGLCYWDFYWKDCFEDELHIASHGIGADPACWMEIGYASGFLSGLVGRRILAREVECRSTGHDQCHVIAKPVEEWDEADEDLQYFSPKRRALAAPSSAPTLRANARTVPQTPPANADEDDMLIVGSSAAFTSIMHKVQRVAPTRATVLLLGESGVGKSRFARELHAWSKRSGKRFVEVNCAAIPEQLIESELFGVERGAFSGATSSRAGRFQLADGGTLLLDEVGLLSASAQGKLLRVLQSGELERLGGQRTQKVDVRLVAATNEQLHQSVQQGSFRADLFYRLNVFPVLIPPLRERRDDIPLLLEHYVARFSRMFDRRIRGIAPRALQALLGYDWPGNIREFENVIERSIILAEDGEVLDLRHLFSMDSSLRSNAIGLSSMGSLVNNGAKTVASSQDVDAMNLWAQQQLADGVPNIDALQDALLRSAMQQTQGKLAQAARLLGVSRAQASYRWKKISATR